MEWMNESGRGEGGGGGKDGSGANLGDSRYGASGIPSHGMIPCSNKYRYAALYHSFLQG